MSQKKRPYARYLAIALIVLMLPFVALATAVAATGVVTVKVHEPGPDGTRLWIPVPALLLDLALFAAPMVIPDEALADARREIAPYREGLRELADELESCPSGVLVDVRTRDERVRITKTFRSFRVEVESDDADVRVAVPARLAGRALDLLD